VSCGRLPTKRQHKSHGCLPTHLHRVLLLLLVRGRIWRTRHHSLLWKLCRVLPAPLLYIRSIFWDLGIPQDAASVMYEDNDACTAMAMAQKPTPRTRHMDIKYYALCEWVERDLIKLERIDTSINLADHFTKSLSPILFWRHLDYVMGRVPPAYSKCHTVFRDLSQRRDDDTRNINTPAVHRLVCVWQTILDTDTAHYSHCEVKVFQDVPFSFSFSSWS
jgi:hypothetical protein